MPEMSDQQRRKLAELEPWFASARLIDALERRWEIHFRCTVCGATKTWRCDTFVGKAKALLGATMSEIQRRTPCPQCRARMPAMSASGLINPGDGAEHLRWQLINTLIDAGLKPTDYGIGWQPPARRQS
jgi:hypothetical protein